MPPTLNNNGISANKISPTTGAIKPMIDELHTKKVDSRQEIDFLLILALKEDYLSVNKVLP